MMIQPHYLELLNTIAIQEREAGIFLQEWAQKTNNDVLRANLALVARRETSHYEIFNRRIEELGFTLEDRTIPELVERKRIFSSNLSDTEKNAWRKTRMSKQKGHSIRDKYVAAASDETVDLLTRSLLRWFADVEEDSTEILNQSVI